MEETRYKILLIEDDEIDKEAFERFVKDEKLLYDCTVAASVSEAQSILASEQFDTIVSDYSLGDGTALNILDSVKNTPIIIVTGSGDEEVAVKAWRGGAYDYLTKDSERNYLKAIPKAIENAIEHKKLEEALDRKQKNLETIFDAAPVGMLLADENTIITRINNTIKQLVHREYQQIINQQIGSALGCVNSTDNEKGCGYRPACTDCLLQKTIKNVLDSGQSVRDIEIQATLKIDNKETMPWFRMSAEPVIIDGCRHVIVALGDITEHRKTEYERHLAEEKYRMIFENSAVAITMADEQERLISWNKFTEDLLGMDREDLHLRPVSSLYPLEEWEKIRACDVRQKGLQYHLVETRMIRKDGTIIDVDISLSVLKNPEDEIIGSIGIIRDITERRKAEEKFKETMEIKSQFISTVSHELRTPLAAIKEGVSIVLDEVSGKLNKKQKKFLDIAKRNTDRLSVLIDGVLDFQKLEAGRMKLDIQSNNIEEVVSEAHETMALYAKKNEVELSFELAEDLPKAKFDRAKIIQVLTNLVSNAIKFTPEKGRVSVSIQHQNEKLIITVSDTGMGIPKEALPKIFERFYRVKRHGKQIQGTGLGLAIVHKIVMMHSGRIEVESEVDRGTTFTVFLPLDPKSLPDVPSEKKDEVLENAVAD
jgi:PAS domain S-box-containing protein